METLFVKAPAGKICPMEMSQERITDEEFVPVPNNAFYRRMIAEGSLIVRAEPGPQAEPASPAPKSQPKKPKGGNS